LKRFLFACSALLLSNGVVAGEFRLSIATDFTSGDYGTNNTTEMSVVTAKARYKQDKWTMQASLPYLEIKGPTATGFIDGVPVAGAGIGTTESGLGDLKLSLAYLLFYDATDGYGLTAKAKVKVPTADKDKGLGSGESDYYLQVDPFAVIDKTTLFSTVGHKFYGDTSTTNYNDVWYATLGASYRLDNGINFGLGGKYREKSTDTSDDQRSIFLFANNKLSDNDAIDFNATKGFTDSTPDWGVGFSYKRSF
jgi:hypothetical protein